MRPKNIKKIIKERNESLKRDLKSYKESGGVVIAVEILAAGENVCDACRPWNGKKIPLNVALKNPPLPIKNCHNEVYGYCRCAYVPVVAGELGQTVEKTYDEAEDPGTLLKKATALKDTDIDKAIKIIREVIGKYEAQREWFAIAKPAYLKLAHYLQKKGDRDGAWRIYNQMIQKAGREKDVLLIGMHLSDIYSRMASLREKEKSYKDAVLFRIRSFVSKNQALHVQARRKELLPVNDLVDNLGKLSKRGRIEGLQKLVKKALKPLVKEWRKKPPVKKPFVHFEKKESKIRKRYIALDRIASKQIDLITKKVRQ